MNTNMPSSGRVDVLDSVSQRMRRWSAEKLEKEFMFAVLSNDDSEKSEAWLQAIECERNRRATITEPQS